jgi:methylenetetrahydrofolate reductase (NADPH)
VRLCECVSVCQDEHRQSLPTPELTQPINEEMVKIIDKILQAQASEPFFSFEFFPPKTDSGVENLYLRMDRMTSLQPIFVDITWGAGGSTKDLTLAISEYTQTYFGVEVLMHLTCTNMTVSEIKNILAVAKEAGIQNILALRGDPPKGVVTWEPISGIFRAVDGRYVHGLTWFSFTAGGMEHAIDLVKLIRQEHGDYFCIAVAGFPEGHPQSNTSRMDPESDIAYLKQKLDAGADFVLTNFFYDTDVFINYIQRCRAAGIYCPVIPGIAQLFTIVLVVSLICVCCRHDAHPKLFVLPQNDIILPNSGSSSRLGRLATDCRRR